MAKKTTKTNRTRTAKTPTASRQTAAHRESKIDTTPRQPAFPHQRYRWIKLWVTGKMSREVEYQFVNAGDVQDSAVMKEHAEEWARSTSIGQVAEYMRFGWEEVASVPDRIIAEKMGSARQRIRSATAELEVLTLTPTVPCCRRYDCNEPATRKTKLATGMRDPQFEKGVIQESKESEVCEECFERNERDLKNNRERLERLRAIAASTKANDKTVRA